MTAPTAVPAAVDAAALVPVAPDPEPALRRGPDAAPADGAAAFLATLAEYEGCPVERLE